MCVIAKSVITPEMIERGQFYLAALDPDYFGYSSRTLVESIIRVALGLPLLDADQIAIASEGQRLASVFGSAQ